jgi:hypothetical protein
VSQLAWNDDDVIFVGSSAVGAGGACASTGAARTNAIRSAATVDAVHLFMEFSHRIM